MAAPVYLSIYVYKHPVCRGRGMNRAGVAKMGDDGGALESFVVVYNVAKRHNVGTLLRSACAFGVSEVLLVGKHKDFNAFGSHGSAPFLRFRHFFTLPDARSYLKERGCEIIGVEIKEDAKPVHTHPFTCSAAFLLGNEGSGLSEKEMAICDSFIYIAQYGGGTASLNVTVAASIVLHHFAVWAGFNERQRDGPKFMVAERPKQAQRIACFETPEMVAEMRRSRKLALDWLDEEPLDLLHQGSKDTNQLMAQSSEASLALTRLFDA